MERKLAAILIADVCGYSRLVEDDDEATIRSLQACRALMGTSIDAHHGRVVDAPGDNLLAEFPSVVDAVRCAIEMQRILGERNAGTGANRRMDFRIGITLGDIVIEDDRLYGNGVNIAARLESLAEPGGICLSGNAYEQVEGKIELDAHYAGEHAVKNISKPVPVWRIRASDGEAASPVRRDDGNTPKSASSPITPARAVIVLALGLCAVAAFVLFPSDRTTDAGTHGPVEAAATSGLARPSTVSARPVIFVLPFRNLSDDPRQAYFGDGFAEDITTDLSKIDSLGVVSSNAALKYKGKDVVFEELGDLYGIDYVIEGSVRKIADQLRLSVRLVDVDTGEQLWSERYDSSLDEIFGIQDEIRGKILTALRVQLSPAEQQRFAKAPTKSLEAYDFYLRGLEMSQRARQLREPDLMIEAIGFFERAIELDPEYAAAYAALGLTHFIRWLYGWTENEREAILDRVNALYEKAQALDASDPRIYALAMRAGVFQAKYERAAAAAEELLLRFPDNPRACFDAGQTLLLTGQYERAVELLERARDQQPRQPPYAYYIYGNAYHLVGRTEEARDLLREATLRATQFLGNHVMLAIIYEILGEHANARAEAAQVLRISPSFTAEKVDRFLPMKDRTVLETYMTALQTAGVP